MLTNIIDFFIDYFTHLNLKKIIGGIVTLFGLFVMGLMSSSDTGDKAFLYALAGIIVSSIGILIILYDMTKDKSGQDYSDLETLSKAYKQNKDDNQDPPKTTV
jgi:hypothetical protein